MQKVTLDLPLKWLSSFTTRTVSVKDWAWQMVAALVLALFIALVLPRHGFFYDEQAWFNWMDAVSRISVVAVYSIPEVNYLPMYVYILKFVGWAFLQNTPDRAMFAPYLKLIPLFFDFGTLWVLFAILKKFDISKRRIVFVSLNIAFWYNTLIWGQIDSIPVFFLVFSLWLALNSKPLLSVSLFLLALNFKVQAIITFPVLALVLFPQFWRNKVLFLKTAVLFLVMEAIILFPYWTQGEMHIIYRLITSSVDYFPIVSVNAFNFWVFVKGPSNIFTPDFVPFIGSLSYKTTGLILFLISSLFALFPIIRKVWLEIFYNENVSWMSSKMVSEVFLVAGICSMNFFFFNTQMHERYLHPAIVFVAISSIINSRYVGFFLLSLGYFLNLELVMDYTGFYIYKVVNFSPVVTAFIIFSAIVVSYAQLYSGSRSFTGKKRIPQVVKEVP